MASFYGIGVGPGDSKLLTVKAVDTIKQLAGRVPELTQRVTRKLKQTKEKILDDFERRFSKDMKNYEQEQQKSLEKQANRDVQSEKKPTKDHDRGMSR